MAAGGWGMWVFLVGLASASAAPFSFVVVGDTQTDGGEASVNWDVLPQLVEDMNTHDPAFGLFAGDLVGGGWTVAGTQDQWEDFKTATADFQGEILVAPGNHDVYGGAGTFDAWRETFDWLPIDDSPPGEEGVSYYVDHENVRFVSVTSAQETGSSGLVSSDGMAWLDSTLAASGAADHVFVFTHYPMTFSDENYLGGTAGDFWQTVVAYGVTGVFSGHWHRYQPSQPGGGGSTWETIIGTGGGSMFDPVRPYQQMWGFLVVEVDGPSAVASFYADADDDGSYDDWMDSFTMAWPMEDGESTEPHGLIARYSFEDGRVTDDAPEPLGRGIDGQLFRGAEVGPGGAVGDALWLTGVDDYVEAGAIDDYVLSLNGDVTLSTFVQVESLGSDPWANTLICYGTNDYYTEDEETNYSYWLSVDASGSDAYLRFYWEYGEGTNVIATSTVPAPLVKGTWHHVAAVRDADAMEASFYVDGVMLGSPVSFASLPTSGGRGMLYMGSDTPAYAGYGYELDGGLDEVCIYDVVLGADAVAALAAGEDCVAVLGGDDPPEDTGDVDTGAPSDTGDTGGDGDTGTADSGGADSDTDPDPDVDTDESADTAVTPGEPSGGCGCAPTSAPTGVWFVVLGSLIAVGRRRVVGDLSSASPHRL